MKYRGFCIVVCLATTPWVASAATIDRFLQIQPIQICDNGGANCADTPLLEGFTQGVFAKARVATVFLPTKQVDKTSLLTVNGLSDVDRPGNGQSANPRAINAWYVEELNSDNPGSVVYGEGYFGASGVVVNASAVSTQQRQDTLAHETGHNLGLGHDGYGAGGPDNLMTQGGLRDVPADDLTPAQIGQIRASGFVRAIPEVTVAVQDASSSAGTGFFDVAFGAGPSGISLTRLAIDLSPTGAFFGPSNGSGGALSFGTLDGLSPSDVTATGLAGGSQSALLEFAPSAFMAGDRIAFGSDAGLFDGAGASVTAEDLVGALFGFQFDIDLALVAGLSEDLVASTLSASQFGAVLGEVAPIVADPPPIGQIPLPSPFALLLAALGGAGAIFGAGRPGSVCARRDPQPCQFA